MTDPHPTVAKADTRLRSILSSWHKSRGYRSVAAPNYRNLPVRFSSQTDLNREFKRQRRIGWNWFLIALLAFTAIDYLWSVELGLKAKK
jgi:hypothetical protein